MLYPEDPHQFTFNDGREVKIYFNHDGDTNDTFWFYDVHLNGRRVNRIVPIPCNDKTVDEIESIIRKKYDTNTIPNNIPSYFNNYIFRLRWLPGYF
ncbi:MAG: hypothetical protein KKB03_04840 [Nanoarchaeota archaeon]|nr:hypothetical protein [Nanoarchaeota archaeon]